ncbi:MAG: cyclic nucleotide-binding domain-containing protein [Proteobacteria bacterium]|nr:cyclic nucleotide-binding domain-containing protein [Pseudomonadota bacterium]MBU1581496.1 cyclic nucleotide-binding domain-containing protein [Pseudomonadota bacterium]MBU2455156.1 cyclic nucleotide-binding domain-containing protein [Pseudomonadota bacterium]MBU2628865.1 cyclic nucleotide-binding domain-containing protein [Pseudomonadota bacterium]
MGNIPEKKIHFEKYAKYAQILEKTRWASEFSWDDIRKICHYIHPVSAKKGAVIFKEGADEESLGIIVKGSIDILKQGDDGNKKVATLKSSQTFGEMALLDGEPRSASGVAAEDTIIFFISKQSLIDIASDHPKLGFQILWKISKLISQHLRKTTGKLVDYMEK